MLRSNGCVEFSAKHQSQRNPRTIKLVTVIPQNDAVIWNAEPPNGVSKLMLSFTKGPEFKLPREAAALKAAAARDSVNR